MLLQIVLVSPATHLVKNHQSHSRTNESQLKENESFRLILFGPWAKTDSKTLYLSLPKSKYSPSTYSTKKTYAPATEITRTEYSTKTSSDG